MQRTMRSDERQGAVEDVNEATEGVLRRAGVDVQRGGGRQVEESREDGSTRKVTDIKQDARFRERSEEHRGEDARQDRKFGKEMRKAMRNVEKMKIKEDKVGVREKKRKEKMARRKEENVRKREDKKMAEEEEMRPKDQKAESKKVKSTTKTRPEAKLEDKKSAETKREERGLCKTLRSFFERKPAVTVVKGGSVKSV